MESEGIFSPPGDLECKDPDKPDLRQRLDLVQHRGRQGLVDPDESHRIFAPHKYVLAIVCP